MTDKKVTPVPAATILLCRDSAEGIETFMVVRHRKIDFASGALVFPGGKVCEGDSDPRVNERCAGLAEGDGELLPYMVGAIRETFEECGILLAREAGSENLVPGSRLPSLVDYRGKLNSGEVSLADFLESEDLVLACDCVHRFAHWVTPEGMPKRFDTQFFIAQAPADHLAVHDGSESVDSTWISTDRLLAAAEKGAYTVIFPTRCNILMLGQSRTVDEAIAQSRNRDIVTVTPWIEKGEDGSYLHIPKEAGYPVGPEKLDREGLK